MIKAIFFDMDGTLVYVSVSPAQFLKNIYQKLGLHFSLDEISVVREKAENWWTQKYSDYRLRTHEAFVEYNYRLLKDLGTKGDLQTLAERVQSYWENFPKEANEKLYPEVRNVLRGLKEKGIALGVLSNRLAYASLKSLETHSIGGYFNWVIGPQIAGAPNGKESPEIWQFALNKASCKPNEVLHIDNDYESGIIGAKKAGIRPVLADRKDRRTSTIDCIVIHDLTEIFELLESL